ncbi:MAG TPA: dihydrolipoamide acetyltransferase family protein [Fimbriimonadaceae bacterium]|nr:dihydrolipoamide acetyltransferase family protein [Fimbriimonadaceae bacterium]
MTEVIMPKMGDGMEEGTLLEWLKKEGEKVKSGDVIGTIQTDKATLELEAPGSGYLAGILIASGETVPVGRPIAALLKEGESLPAGWGTGAATSSPDETPAPEPVKVVAEAAAAGMAAGSSPRSQGRVKASPLAKSIAAEKGIDLSGIAGTGPGGRIVERDVLKALEFVAPARESIGTFAAPVAAEDRVVPLNRLRQIIAQRTQQAKQQIPHFYVTVEVDCERMLALKQQFEDEGAGKITINDFVIRASVLALQEMPNVNATFNDNNTVTQYGAIHIGVAAAVDEGLLVPVIKNAQAMSIRGLSSKARELVAKARDGKLLPDEMSGSTFSISNMGMLDVDHFAAIINQPNAAIVAVSSVRKLVVPTADDEIEIRSRMNVTGSFDHRVLDGAVGAKFMNVLRTYLENPTRLLA